ncbi:hypothetical protein CRUP_035077 [Coryphaenoides rupestris]|nr:hypothetical protein CRUP_035077 [Coryphaenoides rupestris]
MRSSRGLASSWSQMVSDSFLGGGGGGAEGSSEAVAEEEWGSWSGWCGEPRSPKRSAKARTDPRFSGPSVCPWVAWSSPGAVPVASSPPFSRCSFSPSPSPSPSPPPPPPRGRASCSGSTACPA